MKKRLSCAVISKSSLTLGSDEQLTLLRELGTFFAQQQVPVLTHFSSSVRYVKEAVLALDGEVISLSPACSKEEHETIFKLEVMPNERIIYTGSGRELSILMLLRSLDTVVALDEAAKKEALSFLGEADAHKVMLLSTQTVALLEEKLTASA